VLVTNQPYWAVLAEDCPNTRAKKVHDHLTIGFDKDLRTADVSAYSKGWCRAYAAAFKEFVNDPIDKRCVHCLPQGESKTIYHRREMVRRCAEVVGLGDQVDAFSRSFDMDRGEVFMVMERQKLGPIEEVESRGTHLGARCEQAPPYIFVFGCTIDIFYDRFNIWIGELQTGSRGIEGRAREVWGLAGVSSRETTAPCCIGRGSLKGRVTSCRWEGTTGSI
jgi:hypothetical protein